MPSNPSGIWINTPNKIDHNTKGYTSKVIFNSQYTGTTFEVEAGSNIIANIVGAGNNFKGSPELRVPYFKNADGRCFRISLYYLKPYDGNAVDLSQQLYDIDNGITYDFNLESSGGINADTGNALVKYECYLSVFWDNANSQYVAQANGTVIYAQKPLSNLAMLQMSAYNILTNGYNTNYRIEIKNNNGATIYPISLMIEEIS